MGTRCRETDKFKTHGSGRRRVRERKDSNILRRKTVGKHTSFQGCKALAYKLNSLKQHRHSISPFLEVNSVDTELDSLHRISTRVGLTWSRGFSSKLTDG